MLDIYIILQADCIFATEQNSSDKRRRGKRTASTGPVATQRLDTIEFRLPAVCNEQPRFYRI